MTFEIAFEMTFNFDYDRAWLYCITLEYNNHKDWRLPYYEEWNDNEGIFQYNTWHDWNGNSANYPTPLPKPTMFIVPVRTI